MSLPPLRLACIGLLFLFTATSLQAQERVQFLQPLVVEAGETLEDVVCIGCSIQVEGTVTGDAVAVAGGITINGSVQGDAVSVGSGIRLGPGAQVQGDCVAVGGPVERGEGAEIGGEVVSTPSLAWLLFLGLAVITAVLVLIVVLIVGGIYILIKLFS